MKLVKLRNSMFLGFVTLILAPLALGQEDSHTQGFIDNEQPLKDDILYPKFKGAHINELNTHDKLILTDRLSDVEDARYGIPKNGKITLSNPSGSLVKCTITLKSKEFDGKRFKLNTDRELKILMSGGHYSTKGASLENIAGFSADDVQQHVHYIIRDSRGEIEEINCSGIWLKDTIQEGVVYRRWQIALQDFLDMLYNNMGVKVQHISLK